MIQFFYGTDHDKRGKAHEAAERAFLKENAGFEIIHIDVDGWSEEVFGNAVGGSSFFSVGSAVVGRDLWSSKNASAFLLDWIDGDSAKNAHVFFVDDDLPKELLKKIGKRKDVLLSEHELLKKEKVRSSYPFDYAGALLKGDKKTAWLVLQKAALEGESGEEMYWGISWKIKDALSRARHGDEMYEKAAKLSRAMIKLYHEAKSGGLDFDLAFERLALSV